MKFKKNKSISINEPNDINIKINTTTWNKAIENLKYDKTIDINQYIFNKLGFTHGDEIQIFPVELTEEMNKKIPGWSKVVSNYETKALPKYCFKIVSSKKGKFILGICSTSVVLLNETSEKLYSFIYNDMVKLEMEKDIVYNENIKLEIICLYNKLLITCEEVNRKNRSLKFDFSINEDLISCFDDSTKTIQDFKNRRSNLLEITQQLLNLKAIPDNNDIIKLFGEISLNSFFKEEIVLKEIVLSSETRDDIIKFENKRVSKYQINDSDKNKKRISSNGYSMISAENYKIETSNKGININIPAISKKSWLNEGQNYLTQTVKQGISEQKNMECLFDEVEEVVNKSLKLKNK